MKIGAANKWSTGMSKKPLNLGLVKVHCQHAIGPSRHDEIGHEFGRDWHARFVLPVLPGVAIVWHDGRDSGGGRPTKRIDHHAELDEMLVNRSTGRLQHEDIGSSNVFVDLKRDLTVGETLETGPPGGPADQLSDLLSECRVRTSREQLQLTVVRRHVLTLYPVLVGAEGFEPSITGFKVPRLTAWPRPILSM